MPTLVMVRTICCESHVSSGQRCLNCPGRQENRAAVREYQSHAGRAGRGRSHGLLDDSELHKSTALPDRPARHAPAAGVEFPRPISRIVPLPVSGSRR